MENTNTNHEPTAPKTADEVRTLLVQQRQKLELTQNDIAKVADLKSNALVSNVETGLRRIPKKRTSDFAKAYQLPEETLAPLVSVSGKIGGRIGRKNISDGNINLDVLPLIKKIAASKRETVRVAELNALIGGYAVLQKSLENLAPEVRDLLISTFDVPKADS